MRWHIAFASALFLVCAAACARADSAASPTPGIAPPESFALTDARLAQKVSLDVTGATLAGVLAGLAKQTGVMVHPGTGDWEWRVRERRVTIRAKNARLIDLLTELTRLLHYRIARGHKGGEYTYLVWQDMNSRDLEAHTIADQKQQAAERAADARQGVMDDAAKALAMTGEDAMKLKDTDPWMAYLGGTKPGRAFAAVLTALPTLNPDAYALMMSGNDAEFLLTDAPAGIRQAARNILLGGFEPAVYGYKGDIPASMFEVAEIRVTPIDRDPGGGSGIVGLAGAVRVVFRNTEAGGQEVRQYGEQLFLMAASGSKFSQIIGDGLLDVAKDPSHCREAEARADAKASDPVVYAELYGRDTKAPAPGLSSAAAEREIDIKDMPRHKSGQGPGMFKGDEEKFADALFKVLGTPVIMESFRQADLPSQFLHDGKQTIAQLILNLQQGGCLCRYQHEILGITSEKWALYRSYEISPKVLQHYRDLVSKNGCLTLEEMADLTAQLTDDQIDHGFDRDDILKKAGIWALYEPGTKSALRLYSSLSTGQRAALMTGSRVSLADLDDAQWETIQDWVERDLGRSWADPAQLSLQLKTTEGKTPAAATKCEFEISPNPPDDNQTSAKTAFWLPTKEGVAEAVAQEKKIEEQQREQKAKAEGTEHD